MYAEPLNGALYCRHMLRAVSRFLPAHTSLAHVADAIGKNTKLTNEQVSKYLEIVYEGVAYAYSSNRTDGALLVAELVAPVNVEIAPIFSRLVLGLQSRCVFLNYAEASLINEDARYALVVCMFTLCKYADYQGAVADAVADLTAKPAFYSDDPITAQNQLALAFFGLAWATLYASSPMTSSDVIRDIFQLRPPFVNSSSSITNVVEMPNDFDIR